MNIKTIFLSLIILFSISLLSCKKDSEQPQTQPTENLAIDSLVATKTNIRIWEEIYIKAYTKGKNLSFHWSVNHGTLESTDSSTVKYWACPTCVGLNTIECKVSNDFGTVSDTIMINVY